VLNPWQPTINIKASVMTSAFQRVEMRLIWDQINALESLVCPVGYDYVRFQKGMVEEPGRTYYPVDPGLSQE